MSEVMIVLNRELYLDQLRPLIGSPLVKLLTGVRGAGKTTLLQLMKNLLLEAGIPADHIISINLELMEASEVSNDVRLLSYIRYRMVNPGRHFILLDEIQMVDDWEKAVFELAGDLNCDLYLAGSDAGRLAEVMQGILPGRFSEIRIKPLSLAEYTAMEQSQQPGLSIDLSLAAADFIRRGGLPGLAAIADDATRDQVGLGLYRSILYQDVILRNHIRDAELLNRVMRFILVNTGKVYAVKTIGDHLVSRNQRASAETLANYLRSLTEAGLIFRVPRLDLRSGMVLHNNVKYFLADHGLLRVVTGQRDRNTAGILQNTIFLELYRRGFKVMVGKLGNATIDFVAEQDGRRLFIQIIDRRLTPDVVRKTAEPFSKIKGKASFFIIARDPFGQSALAGVRCLSLADFLLAAEI